MNYYIIGYIVSVVGGILFVIWNNNRNKEKYRLNIGELLTILFYALLWPVLLFGGFMYGLFRIWEYGQKTVDYYWTKKDWKSRKIF